ncbi:MAG: SDR family oxidoreductase [Planctomycetales bacterium]|nr:SDR family oxidoreductase [Planctomycetales bacterium]
MTTSMDLRERVAVVTGAASGIGRAIARRLASAGAKVVGCDFDRVATTEAEDAELGIEMHSCDVRQESDICRVVDAAAQHGSVTILVNNAGIGMVKQIDEVTQDDWDRCLDTNLRGAFFGCKHVIPRMRAAGGGSIVNIASNAGLLPRAHDPVYSISKGALVALTRSLALCHSVDRIRVNSICPGPVGDTRMMNADLDKAEDREASIKQFIAASPLARALERMISPAEVAEAALYLVSDAAAMVTGTHIAIDGGKSLGVPPSPGS